MFATTLISSFPMQRAAELAHRPIEYDTGFTLLPGKYMIKFLARDDETGRIGTYQTMFVIPNLNKEEKRIPISSVVLSSQRVDLKEALYDAEKAKRSEKEDAVNPLVQDGKKLVPSVTRVFSTSREMYVYLQAYKPPELNRQANTQPLFGFVGLYQGGKKVFETPHSSRTGWRQPAWDDVASASHSTSITFFRENILPDHHLDPTTLKANFWRAPVLLVP